MKAKTGRWRNGRATVDQPRRSSSRRIANCGNRQRFPHFKHDLQAGQTSRHLRQPIEAHLSIVVAAMADSHYIEHQTGWSFKKFVRTAQSLPHRENQDRTVRVKAGRRIFTAADRLPDELREAMAKISGQLET